MDSYRLGKRRSSHRKRNIVIAAVFLLLILAGTVWVNLYLRSDTVIDPPPPAYTTRVVASDEGTKSFTEGIFSLSLPKDWVFVDHKTAPYNVYSWHNTKTNPGIQQLQVYIDTIPKSLAVNRVLPVQSEGNRVIPTTVSDNCSDFTGSKSSGSTTTLAKWGGINFLCDLGNYERDVVGTSSSDGVNVVNLTGASGTHKIFFTYTDNGMTPDFTIFTDAIQGFRLK